MTDDLKAEYDEYRAKREAARAEWLEWVRCSGQSNILLSGTGLNTVFGFLNHAANSDLHEKMWEEVERLEAYTTTLLGHIGDIGKVMDLQNAGFERLREENERLICENIKLTCPPLRPSREAVGGDRAAPEGGDVT